MPSAPLTLKRQTMYRAFLLMILVSITACSEFPFVYKIDVTQGNVITQEMVDKLKPGLSKSQVRYIFGTPLVKDTFNQNRWDYVYSLKKGSEKTESKHITLFFVDGELSHFTGDYVPGAEEPDEEATDT